MKIRKTTANDINAVMDIYAAAREYMITSGNPDQWGSGHPPRGIIEQDIKDGKSYVVVDDDIVIAVFYYCIEIEPTYAKIDGAWLNEKSYGIVHRIARGSAGRGKNVGEFCLNWCLEQCGNLRIDTHRDNKTMLDLLSKMGFTYCGIIWIDLGDELDERLAFQKEV